ncbi:hypothetical protein [Knoellia sp. LjRoot47]|uniref:hypothetical protein n=1 Tax=Knoellia sp. LjRoot47 TaxID=3342330 RepID=UPI003ED0B6A8
MYAPKRAGWADDVLLTTAWTGTEWTGAIVRRDVRLEDGTVIEWSPEGWRVAEHWVAEDGRTAVGVLHHEDGSWAAFRMTLTDAGWILAARVSSGIGAVTEWLTASERRALGHSA